MPPVSPERFSIRRVVTVTVLIVLIVIVAFYVFQPIADGYDFGCNTQ